jgi:aminoglycoside phosphotransferase (APT) family kinase protein
MNEHIQALEPYLKAKFSDKTDLSINRLDKLRDGWESDNYFLGVEYGKPRTGADWVWRIYSGAGSQQKAARESNALKTLYTAGYPVPQVFLLETEHSPVNRPFIIMEYIPGEMMWHLLDRASVDQQVQLIDQFCQLFVQLHGLDWKQFDARLPVDEPYFFIDNWLDEAHRELRNFPEIDAAPFLEWVAARRTLFACTRPSPIHRDFHPGNILVSADNSAVVIDWTNFAVTDSRFDLAWTLVLAHAHGRPGLRDEIFEGYQCQAGKLIQQIEAFEAIACAQRLLHLTVSLTMGAQHMGMNAQAVEAMRTDMEPHKRVYRLFIEHTGLQIEAFDNLYGKSEW